MPDSFHHLLLLLLLLQPCSSFVPAPHSTVFLRSCEGTVQSHADLERAPLPAGQDRQWVFFAPRGQAVRLHFHRLGLRTAAGGLCRDYLALRSGLPPLAPGVRKLCGSWDGLELLGGRRVTLHLHTGDAGEDAEGQGFRLEFSCVPATPTGATACPGQFACGPSSAAGLRWTQCLANVRVCDGRAQCPNGEDESGCGGGGRGTPACSPYQTACRGSRQCIPDVWRCDGVPDCPQGDDEEGCEAANCAASEFRCGADVCIPWAWVCDGAADCDDRSDETRGCQEATPKPNVTAAPCAIGTVRCPRENKCLSRAKLCDGIADCRHGSDEAPSFCGPQTTPTAHTTQRPQCGENSFFCHEGTTCIDSRLHCDGFEDCLAGEDERECPGATTSAPVSPPTTPRPPCDLRDIFCTEEATCIDRKFRCDGFADCLRGEDERDCSVTTTYAPVSSHATPKGPCSGSDFFCREEAVCIEKKFHCDGYKDCLRGEDERECSETTTVAVPTASAPTSTATKRSPCNGDDFFCREEAVCIERKFLCDGFEDCLRGEDESACQASTIAPTRGPCELEQFYCKEVRVCITAQFVCDGYHDCAGGEDERNCSRTTTAPQPPQTTGSGPCDRKDFFCPEEALCIEGRLRCDGFPDCLRGADERGCLGWGSTIAPVPTTPATPTRSPCSDGDLFCEDEAICLERRFVCDGFRDCVRGEDERRCPTGPPPSPPPAPHCLEDLSVGGVERREEQLAWMVRIETALGGSCSGVLVARSWVITNTDCVRHQKAEDLRVFVRRPGTDGAQLIGVALLSRPAIQETGIDEADPILLKLESSASDVEMIPVCLSHRPVRSAADEKCVVMSMNEVGQISQSPVRLVDHDICRNSPWDGKVPSAVIQCTAPLMTGKHCGGVSSQSVLLCNDENDARRGFYLRGIAACHYKCISNDCPATFTDMEPYTDWIRETAPDRPSTPRPTIPPRNRTCGHQPHPISLKHPRIVGGSEARRGNWPWALALVKGDQFLCGATLIHQRIALTAAHCIKKCKPHISSCHFIVGGHDIQVDRSNESLKYSINGIRLHPNFTWPTLHNDLAVVRLKKSVPLDITPVCLQSTDSVFDSYHCYVVGFGLTLDPNRFLEGLQEVRVPLIPHSTCSRRNWHGRKLQQGELCAGYSTGGMDACNGDSGGPLQCWNAVDQRWQLVGIATWGVSCGKARKPGVYAAMDHYLPWVTDMMSELINL